MTFFGKIKPLRLQFNSPTTNLELKSLEMMDGSGSTNLWRSGMFLSHIRHFSLTADGMLGPESRMAFSMSQLSLFGPSESLRSLAFGSTMFATSASTLFGTANVGSIPLSGMSPELKIPSSIGIVGGLTFFKGQLEASPQ